MKRWSHFLFLCLLSTESLEAGCDKFLSQIYRLSIPFQTDFTEFVPIGVSAKDFRDFLDFLKDDRIFAEAESIIIYGSRTNHEEGLPPQSDSDLDIRILWRADSLLDDLSLWHQLERVRKVNEALDPWSERFGFKVGIEIPSFSSLSEFILELNPMFLAIRDLENSKELTKIETEEDRLSAKMKTSEILTRHRLSINPGAIFVLKAKSRATFVQERLQALGVRKIISLN